MSGNVRRAVVSLTDVSSELDERPLTTLQAPFITPSFNILPALLPRRSSAVLTDIEPPVSIPWVPIERGERQ